MSIWSEEDVAYLRAKWSGPIPARELGKHMPSGPRTKNSVLGQAHRMGLGPRRDVQKNNVSLPALLDASPPRRCLYPAGDPRSPDFRYCGKPVKDGGSWCPKCRDVVFVTEASA